MQNWNLDQEFIRIGQSVFTGLDLVWLAAAVLALLVLAMVFSIWRSMARRHREEATLRALHEERARDAETRIAELVASQNELAGHLTAMQQSVTSGQAAFSQQLDERLANVTGRVSQTLNESNKTTQESLTRLQERLAVIDNAQNNIQSLAQDVVGLQAILQNKQSRGAFGQSRMEAIVQDGLPIGAFEFQATLSNSSRPDCIIHMPNDAPALVIDAKFPLEAWSRIQDAGDGMERKSAASDFRKHLETHVKDISSKYLISGETQDTAFMFVPSESIFAEIHENFEALVQKAHKARVVIVSPSLLLLSIQVIQALLKDARMREQAHLIQAEVVKFTEDLNRLDERVRKLKTHHDQSGRDIDNILISSGKLSQRGAKIEAMEFRPDQLAEANGSKSTSQDKKGKPFLRAIEGGE